MCKTLTVCFVAMTFMVLYLHLAAKSFFDKSINSGT